MHKETMSGNVYACIAFSGLNAVTAFVIAWLMRLRISSFAITAVVNGWDLDEKAAACRNAGFLYLVLAVGLSIRAVYQRRISTESRYQEEEMQNTFESVPLLYTTGFDIDVLEKKDLNEGPVQRVVRLHGSYGSDQ